MKENIEFQNIGKKTPFMVPDDFFEHISEKTLQRAKLRQQIQRKSLILWKTVAVAASMAAIILLSYFLSEPKKPGQELIVVQKLPQTEQVVKPKPEIFKEPTTAIQKKDNVKKTNP